MPTTKSFFDNIIFSFLTVHKHAKNALYIKIFHRAIGTSKVYVIAAIDRWLLNEFSAALLTSNLVSSITSLAKIVFLNWIILLLYSVFDKIFQIISTSSMMDYGITMNQTLYNKLSQLDISYFDNPTDNNRVKQSFKDMNGILSVCDSSLNFAFSVISFFVSFVIVVRLNVIIACLVVIAIIPSFFLKKHINSANYKQEQVLNNLNRKIDYFANQFFNANAAQDLRVTPLKKLLLKKHAGYTLERNAEKIKLIKQTSIIEMFYLVGIGLLNVGINLYILFVILIKQLLIGDFQYYTTITTKLRQSIEAMISACSEILISVKRVQNYRDFMDIRNNISDGSISCITNEFFEIEFKNVSFIYPNTTTYVLNNVSFSFSSKQKIALAGINGAGKSTIIKLLLRFYDPTEGEILLNGVNIKEYALNSYRKIFSVMFQSYTNYKMSIRENITLSEDRKHDTEILSLLKRMNLGHVALNSEYSKSFDANGSVLSLGQSQSLNFARMLYQDRYIQILDEPSASLDAKAEQKLFDEIFALNKDKGLLLISHRLSNLQSVDQIIFLENGTVTEIGNHEALIKNNGLYKEIYDIQSKKYHL